MFNEEKQDLGAGSEKEAEKKDAEVTSPHGHIQPQLHIEQLLLTVT